MMTFSRQHFRAAALAGCILAAGWTAGAAAPPQQPSTAGAASELFRLVFGDRELAPGTLEVNLPSGQDGLRHVRSWLGAEIAPAADAWSIRMELPARKIPYASMGQRDPEPRPVPGFYIEVDAGFGGSIEAETSRGNLSFRPSEVAWGRPQRLLGGLAKVERVPHAQPVADSSADEDYPAIAPAGNGSVWVAWISFVGNGERLLLARMGESGLIESPRQVNEGLGELFRPQVATDAAGRVWVVWSEMRRGNWDLYARSWDGQRWSPVDRLSNDPGPDASPALASDSEGTLWLAWQGHQKAPTSEILLLSCRAGRWQQRPAVIGAHPASDWEPALAVDSRNRVHVAWSSYRNGSHDIYLATVEDGVGQQPRRLTGGNRLHIRPSLAVDQQDRLWVAWEQGAGRWGKDTVQTEGGLHIERRVVVGVLEGGRLRRSEQSFTGAQTLPAGEIQEHVRLQVDAQNRLWAFYRITYMQRYWQQAAIYYEEGRWSDPLVLDRSLGRQAVYTSTAADGDQVWLAYAGDDRTEETVFRVNHNDVYLARIPNLGAAAVELAAGAEMNIPPPAGEQHQRTWPGHEVRLGSRTYKLAWGELHKHTDIDHHGRPDGSLEDAYRYARDAADLDFFATTDHISPAMRQGLNPTTWWRSQKYADLHLQPGRFITLYAYESSKSGPQGHRNMVFPRRGGALFGGVPGPTVNDPRPLWEALRSDPAPGIAIPHQLTDSQVDWSIHDPDFTPLMEIYQSRRQNYEYDGAPQPPGVEQVWGKKAGSWAWDALAMGRKVGFIASTDHMSSHMAYAGAYVEEMTRESVFDALVQRHTYAASDNIVLDFRLVDEAGDEHLMGEEVELAAPRPAFHLEVIGTAAVAKVELVRDGKFIYTAQPGQQQVRLRYEDNEPLHGESYYYVRITQTDGHLAWSSPIWVKP